MWARGWRDTAWADLDHPWDIIIIGGGITGAGLLREAVRSGWRTLLLEAHDFASGTSSLSSKLVHGGLRYLRNAQWKVTYHSVGERQRLLREGKGLINRLGFLYAVHHGDPIPGWVFGAGLAIYDLMALRWSHRRCTIDEMRNLCSFLTNPRLLGGYRYFDALTDDARLVLRILQEAVAEGGLALNYAPVTDLLRNRSGQVCGVVVEDGNPENPNRQCELLASVVINATGAWADRLRGGIGLRPRLRLIRGSHLVLPGKRLPLTRAVGLLHPTNRRPVFMIPWEGATLVGTTDLPQDPGTLEAAHPSQVEVAYLLEAAQHAFPGIALTPEDVQATYAGVRAVMTGRRLDLARASREHLIWSENGLLTVSGGKLTTFRLMAHQALGAVASRLPHTSSFHRGTRVLDDLAEETLAGLEPLPVRDRQRFLGRYGHMAANGIAASKEGELATIPPTNTLLAEVRWAARAEGVLHLDDLLMRRVRLGLLLPNGGRELLPVLRGIAQPELGWDDARWQQEERAYLDRWDTRFRPPR